jgi:hypothetical protein
LGGEGGGGEEEECDGEGFQGRFSVGSVAAATKSIPQRLKPVLLLRGLRDSRLKPWGT